MLHGQPYTGPSVAGRHRPCLTASSTGHMHRSGRAGVIRCGLKPSADASMADAQSVAGRLVTGLTVSSLLLCWAPPPTFSQPIATSSTLEVTRANEQQVSDTPPQLPSAPPLSPAEPLPATVTSAIKTSETPAAPALTSSTDAPVLAVTSTQSPALATEAPTAAGPPSSPPLSILISEQDALSLPSLPTTFPDLPNIKPPQFQEAVLSNGLRVKMLEDHEVPLVQGTLLMRGGTHASPPNQVGLATLSMATQRGGGTERLPGPELDLKLEQLAAGVEAGAGPQGLSVDFFSSTEDLAEVVGLWADVLRHPALPADRLSFYQDQVLNRLEHRNDSPTGIARRELLKLMYGPTSMYARQPTVESITSITVEDVKRFLSKWERPDTAVLGVVGDFKPDQLIALLEEQLKGWGPAPGEPAQAPERIRESDVLAPASAAAGKVFVVDRPGLSQASVAMSEPGVSLMDPDAYALDLLSTSFNSFGGELFDQLRSREGLAYSVFGAWDSPPDRQGVFVGGGETSSPGDFIVGLRRVLNQATERAPAVEVLEDARAQALNAFVFNFASSSAQLQRSLAYDLLGLPPDLLFRYRDGVSRVTREDVLAAAQRHLHPDKQVTVVVGDALQVVPLLDAAGLQTTPLRLTD